MLRWQDLLNYPEEQLGWLDIAAVNLACAAGLPAGPTPAEFQQCLAKLDSCAELVRRYTKLSLQQFFRPNPAQYNHSEALFRSICLVGCLQRHGGLRYNPAKIAPDAAFDARDAFVHGALLGDGGTCATIPVVLAAVGQRLGYPIQLAETLSGVYGHCFARWDDPGGERLNLEATAEGLATPDDDHYRTGRYAMTPQIEAAGGFLKSLTPRQELAGFLAQRAYCWREVKGWRQAVEARIWASTLDPDNRFHADMISFDKNAWWAELEAKRPPGFPEVFIRTDGRHFPSVPLRVEREVLGHTVLDNVLQDPELDSRYWEPLRRGRALPQVPVELRARFQGGSCEVTLQCREAASGLPRAQEGGTSV